MPEPDVDLFVCFPEVSSWCVILYSTPNFAHISEQHKPDRLYVLPILPACLAHSFWSSVLLYFLGLLTTRSPRSQTLEFRALTTASCFPTDTTWLMLCLSAYGPVALVSSACFHLHSVVFVFLPTLSLI